MVAFRSLHVLLFLFSFEPKGRACVRYPRLWVFAGLEMREARGAASLFLAVEIFPTPFPVWTEVPLFRMFTPPL